MRGRGNAGDPADRQDRPPQRRARVDGRARRRAVRRRSTITERHRAPTTNAPTRSSPTRPKARRSRSAGTRCASPARPCPHGDRHRHGLRRRHARRRRHVERGVLLDAAAHPLPVHRRGRRQQPRDLPRLARQVGDGGADPHVRARTTKGGASSPATRARRSCTSRSPTWRRARKATGPHGRRARCDEPAARHGRRSTRAATSTCSSPTARTR